MEVNTIESPLILRWSICSAQYKINKSLDQSGEYIDKSIAEKLKADNEVLINALKDVFFYMCKNSEDQDYIGQLDKTIQQCESK